MTNSILIRYVKNSIDGEIELHVSASIGGVDKNIGISRLNVGESLAIVGAMVSIVFPVIDGTFTAKVERRIASR